MKPFEKRLMAAIVLMMIVFIWLAVKYMGGDAVGAAHLVNDTSRQIGVRPAVDSALTPISVHATIYHATESQTDSTPLVTASGFKIDPVHPEKHRICGLSRDLLKPNGPYDFGDYLRSSESGDLYNGRWQVQDKMAAYRIKKIKIESDTGLIVINDTIYIVRSVDFLVNEYMPWISQDVMIEKL